jgi:hypothetical protein
LCCHLTAAIVPQHAPNLSVAGPEVRSKMHRT